MTTQANTTIEHGAARLPHIIVDSYNLEIRDKEGWIGDQASRTAFCEIVEEWRKLLKRDDADPFADKDTGDVSKQFDKLLEHSDPAMACVAHAVIECDCDVRTERVRSRGELVSK